MLVNLLEGLDGLGTNSKTTFYQVPTVLRNNWVNGIQQPASGNAFSVRFTVGEGEDSLGKFWVLLYPYPNMSQKMKKRIETHDPQNPKRYGHLMIQYYTGIKANDKMYPYRPDRFQPGEKVPFGEKVVDMDSIRHQENYPIAIEDRTKYKNGVYLESNSERCFRLGKGVDRLGGYETILYLYPNMPIFAKKYIENTNPNNPLSYGIIINFYNTPKTRFRYYRDPKTRSALAQPNPNEFLINVQQFFASKGITYNPVPEGQVDTNPQPVESMPGSSETGILRPEYTNFGKEYYIYENNSSKHTLLLDDHRSSKQPPYSQKKYKVLIYRFPYLPLRILDEKTGKNISSKITRTLMKKYPIFLLRKRLVENNGKLENKRRFHGYYSLAEIEKLFKGAVKGFRSKLKPVFFPKKYKNIKGHPKDARWYTYRINRKAKLFTLPHLQSGSKLKYSVVLEQYPNFSYDIKDELGHLTDIGDYVKDEISRKYPLFVAVKQDPSEGTGNWYFHSIYTRSQLHERFGNAGIFKSTARINSPLIIKEIPLTQNTGAEAQLPDISTDQDMRYMGKVPPIEKDLEGQIAIQSQSTQEYTAPISKSKTVTPANEHEANKKNALVIETPIMTADEVEKAQTYSPFSRSGENYGKHTLARYNTSPKKEANFSDLTKILLVSGAGLLLYYLSSEGKK